jgi:Ca-activated chloride channel family protein
MRHILLVSALTVAAFTCAAGQVREPPLEKGQIEDLKGVSKVYVGTSDQSPSLPTRTIIETVRKRLPQITFVSLREEADVWLLFSTEKGTETEINPDPSVDGHSSAKLITVLRLAGRVIRFRGPGPSKLIKKFSATGRSTDRSSLARDFAEEFIKLYSKANPGKQSGAPGHPERDATTLSPQVEVPGVQPATTLPPHLKGEKSPVADNGPRTPVPTAREAAGVSEGEILRTDTSLVTIHANVIGRDGVPAPVLHQDDFSVYEDDIKQDIAFFEPVDRPFTVVLLIDASTSVDPQLSEIVKAAKVLIDHLRPDDQLVIVTFNKKIKEEVKLTKVRELRGESVKISPQGGTRLYDAVDFAASQYLRRLPGRKAVVLLTDGVDLGSFKATAQGSLHDAEEYDALFYTVQYKTFQDHPMTAEKAQQEHDRATFYLRELAEKTGGRHYWAEDMGDLSPAFTSIVKELSYQYSLGYYPLRPPQPGERRRIRVRVSGSNLVVHTRDSYVSKSP